MKAMDAHIQRIIEWRENFATLPDTHFFELIRMYLGEVHTPYNKPKLIEELGAFLRREENRRTLVSLLSEGDILLLSAVHCIPCATQEKLAHFFEGTFNFANVYERLLNLEERLILWRHGDKKSGKIVISINPMLEDVLLPFLNREVLLPVSRVVPLPGEKGAEIVKGAQEVPGAGETPLATAELLASFVCYVLENPDLCKTDGSFKKRSAAELEKLFPGRLDCLKSVSDAFRNLGLMKETENGFEADLERLRQFASLSETVQLAYLCVACQGRFSRSALVSQAQLLLDVCREMCRICESEAGRSSCMQAASGDGLTRSVLLRLAFLLSEKDNDVPGLATFSEPSRFSAILDRARRQAEDESVVSTSSAASAVSLLDRLIDSALSLGIIQCAGKDESGNEVLCVNRDFSALTAPGVSPATTRAVSGASSSPVSSASTASASSISPASTPSASYTSLPKVLMIDAAFTVTLMRGLPLSRLLDVVLVMNLVRFDTAATFEISRKSVMRAFDSGMSAASLENLLSSLCPFPLPQNLLISLEDWSRSYASASIFKGYVLKVDAENIVYTEKNPVIAPFITATLAPGVYLLSVQSDEEVQRLIEKSGLDFIGKIKTTQKPSATLGFPPLYPSMGVKAPELEDEPEVKNARAQKSAKNVDASAPSAGHTTSSASSPAALSPQEQRAAHFEKMRAELDKLTMSPEQRDGLLHRISQKIILNPAQLRSDSVRLEKIEAGGMDYNGKVHVIEGAITTNSIIELEYDDPKCESGVRIVMGTPLSLEKTGTDTLVRLRLEPSKEEAVHSVGKARFLKRIRGSVLR